MFYLLCWNTTTPMVTEWNLIAMQCDNLVPNVHGSSFENVWLRKLHGMEREGKVVGLLQGEK